MEKVKQLPAFYLRLIQHPLPLLLAVIFVTLKVWSNIAIGASLFIGLRSGLIGLLVYGLALGLIFLLSTKPLQKLKHPHYSLKSKYWVLFLLLNIYFFNYGSIIDVLQRQGFMPGTPLYNYLPGYAQFSILLTSVSQWKTPANIIGLESYMFSNIIKGQMMFVLLPLVILSTFRMQCLRTILSGGELKPSLPFLIFFLTAFIVKGITATNFFFLLYAFLYPGFCEEFYYRGILQPIFSDILRSPAWGMGLSVLLFALLHLPDFIFRVYSGSLLLALSSAGNVLLFGALMSYGVYRTGMLWPWMLIHALSNVVGF